MPSIAPLLRGFGRGIVRSGAVRPLAIGAGAAGTLYVGSQVIKRYGEARNPPLQRENLDPNPYLAGDESTTLFDPRTGRTLTFGAQPTDKGDNERSEERTQQLLIWGGIAAVVALIAIPALRGA